MIKSLSHVSFTVSNADAAAAWYVEHLRFEPRRRQRQDNAYTREFIGVPTAVLEVAILGFPGTRKGENGPLLELVEYAEPLSTGVQPVPGNVGFAHLSLFVDEIHDEYRRLSEQGVVFRSQPVRITAGMNEGGYVCYFVDPDGNGLEFFQPPDVASRQARSAPPG
jgi:catechol 2,3-dioxygenase-like lactoylglutathione lyase family enzyme